MQAADAVHGATQATTQGAEAATPFPPFDATLFPSQLLWFVLTFVALYFVMSRFVLPKIGATLDRRAGVIEGDLDQAAEKSAAAENARLAMEKAVAKARTDARAMVDAARAEVQAKLNAEQEAAEARISERIRVAETRVDAAKTKALSEVPGLAEGLARDIAERIAPGGASQARARIAATGDA